MPMPPRSSSAVRPEPGTPDRSATPPPGRTARALVATAVAVVAAAFVLWFGWSTDQLRPGGSDLDQLWFAARAVRAGRDPYALIGPGRPFEWGWPLLYPLPGVVALAPLALLPVVVARMAFVALGAGLLAWALTRDGWDRLPLLAGAAMLDAVRGAQVAPLLAAAVLLPGWQWLAIAKPTLGLAVVAATPSRRGLRAAVAGAALLTATAWLVQPGWIGAWWAGLATARHLRIPVLGAGGPLLLLALARWRRPEARLLLAWACVPHTPVLYDVVPLGLTATTRREALALALLSHAALVLQDAVVQGLDPVASASVAAAILNALVYLPALVLVLRRPNDGVPPAWVAWRRGPAPAYVAGNPGAD